MLLFEVVHRRTYCKCLPSLDTSVISLFSIIMTISGKNGQYTLCEENKDISMKYHHFWVPEIKRRLRKYNFFVGPGIDCNFVRDPWTERIEWFIEGQAFSPLSDLAPFPTSKVCKLDQRHTVRLRKRDILLTGGWGKEPNHKTARKPGPL